MFNMGIGEVILILLVACVIVGPNDLPKVARSLGRGVRSLQRMFDDFKEETGLDEAINELKETERDLNETLSKADPTKELREASKDLNKSVKEVKDVIKPKPKK